MYASQCHWAFGCCRRHCRRNLGCFVLARLACRHGRRHCRYLAPYPTRLRPPATARRDALPPLEFPREGRMHASEHCRRQDLAPNPSVLDVAVALHVLPLLLHDVAQSAILGLDPPEHKEQAEDVRPWPWTAPSSCPLVPLSRKRAGGQKTRCASN